MRTVFLIFNWLFGVLAVLVGLVVLTESMLGGVALMLFASILLPPIRSWVFSVTNVKLSPIARGALATVLFGVAFYGFVTGTLENSSESTASVDIDAVEQSGSDRRTDASLPAAPVVVCDSFNVVTDMEGQSLMLSLETDLPDDTAISVTVGRSYWEKGSDTEYARSYFEDKATVADWRTPRAVAISSDAWQKNLTDFQAEMSRATLGFEVARISDNVDVRIVMPVNGQTNPDFGSRNANLTGAAVESESYGNLVSGEVSIASPL